MDVRHDLMQTLVHLLAAPSEAHRVLSHLQTRGSHAAGIYSLARRKQLSCGDKLLRSLCRATHVRHLCHAQRLIGQYLVGILAVQFVLGGTGQIDIRLLLPRFLAGIERCTVKLVHIRLADVITRCAQLQHILNLLGVEPRRIIHITVWSADGDHLRSQFRSLLCGTPCHIAES